MLIVEIVLMISIIGCLWLGKELLWPLGWYLGLDIPRAWWKDIVYLGMVVVDVILWIPIVFMGFCYPIYSI